ncbi:DUF7533 family protein [Halalkalirubrum salinum]|uniref:DUF7533 family protein n=1 Tax=Halalkalirubrum salinum TaxID=2563889 RepID=UPI0010FB1284|nr:hypothetical protein [Halalkalirubrum salinum]
MRLGIFDMLTLAGSLIFAIPVGNFGVSQLLAGETAMGVGMIVVAIAMVVVPQYVLDPRTIAKRLFAGLLPERLQRSDTDNRSDGDEPSEESTVRSDRG